MALSGPLILIGYDFTSGLRINYESNSPPIGQGNSLPFANAPRGPYSFLVFLHSMRTEPMIIEELIKFRRNKLVKCNERRFRP
jgi:hypothetical protein